MLGIELALSTATLLSIWMITNRKRGGAESLRDQLGDKKWAKLADQKAKELEDDE